MGKPLESPWVMTRGGFPINPIASRIHRSFPDVGSCSCERELVKSTILDLEADPLLSARDLNRFIGLLQIPALITNTC